MNSTVAIDKELTDRLERAKSIIEMSDKQLERDAAADGTGYLALKPQRMVEAIISLLGISVPPKKVIDFGCGNGGFAILAAVAGYESYGVEINPHLIDAANVLYERCVHERLITGRCKFVQGDMILPEYRDAYKNFRSRYNENEISMPVSDDDGSCYGRLGVGLSDADIVYCWSWPTQSRFLYNYLENTTRIDCVFVLPGYLRYTQGEHMNEFLREPNRLVLTPLCKDKDDVFIGRRAS